LSSCRCCGTIAHAVAGNVPGSTRSLRRSGGRRTGHGGTGQSTPSNRLSRYGISTGLWGENIAYGKNTAREIVRTRIIDDDHPRLGHIAETFSIPISITPAPHARYGSVCTINFAAGYTERGQRPPLILATDEIVKTYRFACMAVR